MPSVLWIAVDRTVWPWDQAWYGQVSVDLIDSLARGPEAWFVALVNAFAIKAPLIAWLGEFLVPVGRALGAVDMTLLLIPLVASCLTLVVTFRALMVLTSNDLVSALLGTLAVATAPLFVAMAHQFLVESLQVLAVAWFIWIMICARSYPRAYILIHLIAAAAFAMLAKVSSPLYCFLPGLVGLLTCMRPKQAETDNSIRVQTWKWSTSLVVAGLIVFGAVAWYTRNWRSVAGQVLLDHSGPIADLYGTPAPLIQKLPFWLNAMQSSFFLPAVGALIVGVAVLGSIAYIRSGIRLSYAVLCVLVAFVNLLAVLLSFASATPEETRYLVPAIINIGVILAWGLNRIGSRFVDLVIALGILLQFVAVNFQALGLIPYRQDLSYWLKTPNSDARQDLLINQIVADTCQRDVSPRYRVVAVEMVSFNANTLSYYASKQRLQRGGGECYYTGLTNGTVDAETAWERITSLDPVYVLGLDKSVFTIPQDAFNSPDDQVLARIESSPEYFQIPQDGVSAGVLVFRRR